MDRGGGSRNLSLYPVYVACLNGFFWFPVFFLYLTGHVGLEGALQLEALYYFGVVVFEVPSGWASDRVGRRFALRTAALLLVASYVTFYLSDTMIALAAAQVLLAAGFAFNSGTDTAFHYDSLVLAGREAEYADREGRIARLTFGCMGISALAGGALGAVELRLPYLAAAVTMVIGFLVTLAFERPEREGDAAADRLDRQIVACVKDLSDPPLAWLFASAVLLTSVIHVPYQLYQPYFDLLNQSPLPFEASTPVLTGTHAFAAMTIAAFVSSFSVRFARRLGVFGTVALGLGGGILLVLAIGLVLHPIVALLLVLRSCSSGLLQAPLNAAIAPRIPRERRASFLSVQSLAGRLGFSALLVVLSLAVAQTATYDEVSRAALIATACCGTAWLALVLVGARIRARLRISL